MRSVVTGYHIDRAREELGWRPSMDLVEGMGSTVREADAHLTGSG